MNEGKTMAYSGALLAHGGGDIRGDSDFKSAFLDLAGGIDANFVYIPSALSDTELEGDYKYHLDPCYAANQFGFKNATVLHTRKPEEANNACFAQAVADANAIFFTEGRQWRLADSYLNTKIHTELINLLRRGGVIAGTAAGAAILGSYLPRGNSEPDSERILMGDHQHAFGFLPNLAIDCNILEENRQFDLIYAIRKIPNLLGIGIDSNTSAIFRNNEIAVIGKSYVAIYDIAMLSELDRFYLLKPGIRYSLSRRKLLD